MMNYVMRPEYHECVMKENIIVVIKILKSNDLLKSWNIFFFFFNIVSQTFNFFPFILRFFTQFKFAIWQVDRERITKSRPLTKNLTN
jgi:hypothetical protein